MKNLYLITYDIWPMTCIVVYASSEDIARELAEDDYYNVSGRHTNLVDKIIQITDPAVAKMFAGTEILSESYDSVEFDEAWREWQKKNNV